MAAAGTAATPGEGYATKIVGYEVHPAAGLFPLLEGQELQALAADVKANGLLHPITLYENKILDGRNRALACQLVDVPIRTEVWTGGGSPTAWVVSQNLHRRHLTPSQRAMVAAALVPMFEEEAKARVRASQNNDAGRAARASLPEQVDAGRAREKAAKVLNVSPRSVADAVSVLKNAPPEVVEKVKAGEVAVSAAAKKHRPPARKSHRRRRRTHTPIPAAIPLEARKSIPAFAAFLRRRWTSNDCIKLGKLLLAGLT